MKDRQIQVQSQQMSNLLVDNQILVERLGVSEEALKQLHHEHSKLVVELRNLKASYTAHVLSASRSNEMPVINGVRLTTHSELFTSMANTLHPRFICIFHRRSVTRQGKIPLQTSALNLDKMYPPMRIMFTPKMQC